MTKQKAIDRIASFHYDSISIKENQPYIWTEEDHALYQEAYDRYWNQIHQSHLDAIPMETQEDLIIFLLQKGKSKTWIKNQLRGNSLHLYKVISDIATKYGFITEDDNKSA